MPKKKTVKEKFPLFKLQEAEAKAYEAEKIRYYKKKGKERAQKELKVGKYQIGKFEESLKKRFRL